MTPKELLDHAPKGSRLLEIAVIIPPGATLNEILYQVEDAARYVLNAQDHPGMNVHLTEPKK